jgi:hypothetical protein
MGEPTTFSEGPVTVEILGKSGTPPNVTFDVRMTGPDPNPAQPAPATGSTGKRAAALKKCKKKKSKQARAKCRKKAKKLPV